MLVLGDLNARHSNWGDHIRNNAGHIVDAMLTECSLSVHNLHGQPTFLCVNGHSTIDLLITSTSENNLIADQYTDDTVELFSGAPHRGHVPVITTLALSKTCKSPLSYIKWADADWAIYGSELESSCEKAMPFFTTSSHTIAIWDALKGILNRSRDCSVALGVTNQHNKPYWNARLSQLSKNLREAKKAFKYCSSFANGERLEYLKDEFRSELTRAKNQYLKKQAECLSSRNGTDFWKSFKRTFYSHEDHTIGDPKDKVVRYSARTMTRLIFYLLMPLVAAIQICRNQTHTLHKTLYHRTLSSVS